MPQIGHNEGSKELTTKARENMQRKLGSIEEFSA
jgi:hypothetical protein